MDSIPQDSTVESHRVTRLEVIGPTGREFVRYYSAGVTMRLQDDGRTLKVFVGEEGKYGTPLGY
jgi:hypothetical protein